MGILKVRVSSRVRLRVSSMISLRVRLRVMLRVWLIVSGFRLILFFMMGLKALVKSKY